jgi:hypothetical protein
MNAEVQAFQAEVRGRRGMRRKGAAPYEAEMIARGRALATPASEGRRAGGVGVPAAGNSPQDAGEVAGRNGEAAAEEGRRRSFCSSGRQGPGDGRRGRRGGWRSVGLPARVPN